MLKLQLLKQKYTNLRTKNAAEKIFLRQKSHAGQLLQHIYEVLLAYKLSYIPGQHLIRIYLGNLQPVILLIKLVTLIQIYIRQINHIQI